MSSIILTENIRNLGKIGSVVNVKNGYAFNYLIPQGKAVPATQENIKVIEIKKQDLIKQDEEAKKIAESFATKIAKEVFLAKPINENGALYGAISQKDIISDLSTVPPVCIVHFKKSIISYGVYSVEVELHHDVVLQITVSVSDTIDNAKSQLEVSKKSDSQPSAS